MANMDVEQIGYLCIQGYPKRICQGCTSACCEPVFAHPETNHIGSPSEGAETASDWQP